MTLTSTSVTLAPLKGTSPEMSSCRITPSDQMSVLGDTSLLERICSGDM